jgi:hypothetical protein
VKPEPEVTDRHPILGPHFCTTSYPGPLRGSEALVREATISFPEPAILGKERLANAFVSPGVNSRAELVPSPRAYAWNGTLCRWLGDCKQQPDLGVLKANNSLYWVCVHLFVYICSYIGS